MLMEIERSSSLTAEELPNTSSVAKQLLENFKASKEYRHAFVEEKVRTGIAAQIKIIREQRPMTRPELAALMDKAPSWIFRLEDPNQAPPTISTLLQVAEAFDVDLDIRFGRFSDLLIRLDGLSPESFEVPSFEEQLVRGELEPNEANKIISIDSPPVRYRIESVAPQVTHNELQVTLPVKTAGREDFDFFPAGPIEYRAAI